MQLFLSIYVFVNKIHNTMRFLLMITLLFFIHFSQAQSTVSSAEWRSDLRFLQKRIHQDFSSLFRKISAEDFDARVETLYENIPDLEEHEIVVEMTKLIAAFGYGHTRLNLGSLEDSKAKAFGAFPFRLYAFSDGLFIQGVHQDYARALGAKVLRIGQMDVEQALAAVYPVVSAENEQFFKAYGIGYLTVPEVLHAQGINDRLDRVTLLLEKDGQTFDLTFEAGDFGEVPEHYGFVHTEGDWLGARDESQTPLYLKDLDKIYTFEYLPQQKAVYVRQSQVQDMPDESIAEFYERVFEFVEANEVEKFILDVRLNGGGNNDKNKDLITGIIKCEKINQPGRFFTIIGRRTFSACQNLVNELENYTNVTFVGEPTGENINFFGDVYSETLPASGISVRLSFAWWQDMPQWDERPWMPPHISVELSSDDYFSNQDPALAAIWDAPADARFDPIQHIYALFEQGKMDAVKEKSREYILDPRYKYVPFKSTFLRGAKSLLGQEQYQASAFVYGMLTEYYTEEPEGWLGLGRSYQKLGQTEPARRALQKALALDAGGKVGEQARAILEKL